jgi:hypothetical protein
MADAMGWHVTPPIRGLNGECGCVGALRNCILWGNTAIKGGNQIFNFVPRETGATYSDVQGGWTGSGNLNSDLV